MSAQRGVCLGGGGVYPGGSGRHPLLWTEFLTHACENITFPQLPLRTVINERFRRLVLSTETRSERSRRRCWKAARASTAWDPTRTTPGKRNTRGSCRHHPGYLMEAWDWVEFTWTCCHHVEHLTREDLLQKHRLPLLHKSSFIQAVESLANQRHMHCGAFAR